MRLSSPYNNQRVSDVSLTLYSSLGSLFLSLTHSIK